MGLGISEPLVGGLMIPARRLLTVLRHAIARLVHPPEFGLGTSVALLSERPPKTERDSVVPALICGGRIFARPRSRRNDKAERQSKRQKPGFGQLSHGGRRQFLRRGLKKWYRPDVIQANASAPAFLSSSIST